MFAQYNQRYQQTGGAVATNGMYWNGSAWVSAAGGQGAAAPGAHSSYSTGSYAANQGQGYGSGQQAYGAVAESQPSLVTKFTQYYHDWTARCKEYEEQLPKYAMNSPQRAEAVSARDWAKYYADQSSRAAHHYHSNPSTPAPFELPPEPPKQPPQQQQQPQHQPQLQHQQQSYAPQQQPAPAAAASSDGPPDGLKRYVHRCLEQCQTPEQRKSIEVATEKVIASKLQSGTLHSTNWDATPLIPVPGVSTGKRDFMPPSSAGHYGRQEVFQTSKKQKLSSNESYYGQSSGGGGNQQPLWNGNEQGQSGGGYYGPSSSSSSSSPRNSGTHTTSPTSQNSYYQPQQQQQTQQQGKYGHYGHNTLEDQDFIALPFGKKSKKEKKSNKYVNPKSNKYVKPSMEDGFQRSSNAMAKRANRFSGPGGNNDVRQATAKGIDDKYMGKGVIGGSTKKLDENDYEHMKVKGTCMKLEKQYLRLTAPPKSELVRPLHILTAHLKNLKAEWKSPTKKEYLWFCSEMKSMRQDLVVQQISNAFTVDVYETHARMALQEGDLNEFNQAQTQLRILYDQLDDPKALQNQNEFVSYLAIYFVMLLLNKKYTGGSSDLLNLMLSLTAAQKEDAAVEHALQVRAAVAEVDYHKFFRLYSTCPNLGKKLMDLMVPTVRQWALQRFCRAYRPAAEVDYVLKELGWKVDDTNDLEDGKKFLLSCGCVLNDDGTEINTKDSVVRESDLVEKRSLI